MFCSKCGKEIPDVDGAQFCPQCGVQQLGGVAAAPKKKMSTGVIILIIVAVLGVLSIPVIGIIAAVAIPQFSAQKIKANNAAAGSDLRNARALCETYFAENQSYPDSLDNLGKDLKFTATKDVTVEYTPASDRKSYTMTSYHQKGDRIFAGSSDRADIVYKKKGESDDRYRSF